MKRLSEEIFERETMVSLCEVTQSWQHHPESKTLNLLSKFRMTYLTLNAVLWC